MGKKRRAMAKEDVEGKSAAIAEKLAAIADYKKAKAVLFYAAKGNEVQTKRLVEEALREGKNVLLPVTNMERQEIEPAQIHNPSKDLVEGAFGIMEPRQKAPVNEKRIDIVMAPGLAFDKKGNRLGYGLGFYDKFLARLAKNNSKALKIGLAYEFQIVEQLPNSKYDQRMNILVTEKRLIRCK